MHTYMQNTGSIYDALIIAHMFSNSLHLMHLNLPLCKSPRRKNSGGTNSQDLESFLDHKHGFNILTFFLVVTGEIVLCCKLDILLF